MVRIRMKRTGTRNAACFRIVVMDQRSSRDGRAIEELGYYDPMKQPAEIKVDNEKAQQWMKNGAQPTETVRVLLKKSGAIEG